MRKHLLRILILLMFAAISRANAGGPLAISASPRFQKLTNATMIFRMSIIPDESGPVHLRAYSPTLPGALIYITRETVIPPYFDSVIISVTPTGAKIAGTHLIIIVGTSGAAVARDTVTVSIPGNREWRTFDSTNSPLPSNMITALAVDRHGTGWIGTRRGLMRFDGRSWTSFDSVFHGATIFGIAIDSSNTIWVHFQKLARYRDGVWTIYDRDIPCSAHQFEQALACAPNGDVWAVGRPGILRLRDTTWTLFNDPAFVPNPSSVAVDGRGTVWVGGEYSDKLQRFDGTAWYQFAKGTTKYLLTLAVDQAGDLWTAGGESATHFEPDSILHYLRSDSSFPGYPDVMLFDTQNAVWVGDILHKELVRFEGTKSWHFSIFNSGLPWPVITTLTAAPNRDIWIGTDDGGIAILNGNVPPYFLMLDAPPSPSPGNSLNASLSIFPNPAGENATIHLSRTSAGHARLSLINTLGQEKSVAFDGVMEAGDYDLPVDLARLPAGRYFIRLSEGGSISTMALTIVR